MVGDISHQRAVFTKCKDEKYIDHFKSLFETGVEDRLLGLTNKLNLRGNALWFNQTLVPEFGNSRKQFSEQTKEKIKSYEMKEFEDFSWLENFDYCKSLKNLLKAFQSMAGATKEGINILKKIDITVKEPKISSQYLDGIKGEDLAWYRVFGKMVDHVEAGWNRAYFHKLSIWINRVSRMTVFTGGNGWDV